MLKTKNPIDEILELRIARVEGCLLFNQNLQQSAQTIVARMNLRIRQKTTFFPLSLQGGSNFSNFAFLTTKVTIGVAVMHFTCTIIRTL